jgi:hypothetical protein
MPQLVFVAAEVTRLTLTTPSPGGEGRGEGEPYLASNTGP